MKRVKMTKSFAGVHYSMPAGSIQEFNDEKAERFVSLGHAEYVAEEPEEKTITKEPETAEVKTKFEGRQKRTRKK